MSKTAVSLSLLAALALCACSDYSSYEKPSAPVQKIKKLTLFEVAKGARAWTLTAESAEIRDAGNSAALTNPAIDCLQEKSSATITALRGQFDFEKRNALFEDNVVSFFHNDNARMETAKLYYSPDKAFAWTDVPLKIIRENAQAANTAAAEKSSTTVTALRGQFFMGKRQATLEGTVVALEHRDNVRLETEKLYYSPGLVWTDEKVRITKENVPGLSARPESSGEARRPAREIPPSVMTALRGRFDLEQNNATLEGSVVAESATERRRLETEKLHYSPPRELIWTDEAVKLTQGGTVVRGKGFEAKSDMSEITVRQQETQLSNQ